jgi:hypothetical protein
VSLPTAPPLASLGVGVVGISVRELGIVLEACITVVGMCCNTIALLDSGDGLAIGNVTGLTVEEDLAIAYPDESRAT